MASALIVPLWMLRTILGEDPFNYLDYFEMLGQIYNGDGSIRWRGFIEHQNEHLVLVPKVVIVANVILFDGSRVTLGLFVWLVAAALTAVIALALRPLLRLTPWGRVAAVWTLVLFVFPIAAQHNFRLAISGTAWTLANLLMVTAVLLAVRGHSLRAGLAGVAATLTYGTGLVVWPALVVVLVLRRRFERRDGLMLAMGVLAVLFERLTPSTSEPRPPLTLWLPTIGRNVTATIGELFTDETYLASLIGLGLIVISVISIVRLRPRWSGIAPSFAVACLAVPAISLILIAMSRSLLGIEAFGASRYMGVSALFALYTAVLALLAFGDTLVLRTTVLAFGALSLFGTQQTTDDFDTRNRTIELNAAAVYMGVGEEIAQYYFFVSDVVPALGHVPFDGSFDADCGRWGDRLGSTEIVGSRRGEAGPPTETRNEAANRISGWTEESSPDCLLIIDADRTVVGIGVGNHPRSDGLPPDISPLTFPGFEAYVLVDHVAPLTVVARLEGDDTFVSVAEVPDADAARTSDDPDTNGIRSDEEEES
jgi:hypothetical protein